MTARFPGAQTVPRAGRSGDDGELDHNVTNHYTDRNSCPTRCSGRDPGLEPGESLGVAMKTNKPSSPERPDPSNQPVAKKPYQKPAFRYQRVFETMALSCGKIDPTQGQCQVNTKNS